MSAALGLPVPEIKRESVPLDESEVAVVLFGANDL